MDRRDFFKLSGTMLGGMLLPVSSVQKMLHGASQQKPQFTLLTAPSLDVDVFFEEHNFGSIPGRVFSPFVESLQAGKVTEGCPDDMCGLELNTSEGERPAGLSDFLAPMPYALLPLLAHPISVIQEVQEGYSISGIVIPRPGIEIESDYLPKELLQALGVQPNIGGKIGPYYWRVSLEKHFIGGCIKKDVWHAGAMVKYHATNQLIFNLHICGWWEGSRPCFGVYESRSRWCRKWCTWNVWRALYVLVLSAASLYVSYWIASALAAAIASAAVGVLIAIPGVPPPP